MFVNMTIRRLGYGLMFIAGLAGCLPEDNASHTPQEPVVFSGKVNGENFQQYSIDPNLYTVAVETQKGLKIFRTRGPYAATLDAMLNPGFTVKIKIEPDLLTTTEGDVFEITAKNVIEINGKATPR